MSRYTEAIEAILPKVQRPTRYIGGEWNAVLKDPSGVDVRLALAFPDSYEIGMSHLGLRILYALLNSRPGIWAERVFCPWIDMEAELRAGRIPLTTLESETPLSEFDIVGFSLQYELNYSNILTMMDLGGIPFFSADRREGDPLIIGGGSMAFNPEPLADFFDCILIGDGEDLILDFVEKFRRLRRDGASRREMLRGLAAVEGVYVPSLYDTRPDPKTGFLLPQPTAPAPFPVKRRILFDIDRYPFPDDVVVPFSEIVHDRVSVEIMRGCTVGCRFCQAGIIYRPVRERSPESIKAVLEKSLRRTGFDEASLTSLNSGEYGGVADLISDLMDGFQEDRTSLSLSSLRPSSLNERIAEQIRRVRKTGFTMAPEAGTQRLRDVINKGTSERDILFGAENAFRQGWEVLKLYFMIGLPTETDADIQGILELTHRILRLGRQYAKRAARITLSASSFIPKPHTPFQWLPMERMEALREKQSRIRSGVRGSAIQFKWHDVEISWLEGIFAKGDRTLGRTLLRAWERGCRYDGWTEHFRYRDWVEALSETGVDPERFLYQRLEVGSRHTWDHIDSGVSERYLAKELTMSLTSVPTDTCGIDKCYGCGSFARQCVSGELVPGTMGELCQIERPASLPPPPPSPRHRYRARYHKLGRMRFLSHLELSRTMMRAFRRAGISLAHTEGFHPMPRLAYASALAVGVESTGEYLDFETVEPVDPAAVAPRINGCLPAGLGLDQVEEVEAGSRSLGDLVNAARYAVRLRQPPPGRSLREDLAERIQASPRRLITRDRKGRTEELDILPSIVRIDADEQGEIEMILRLGETGSARPDDVIRGLYGPEASAERIFRRDLLVLRESGLVTPMECRRQEVPEPLPPSAA
ncbi:MAG TPA: TIGR03960 family B12-binding radical SAM protein [Candidatus Polarisedimenticolia bacterium]|nr:TIGR03960 family B12-binding radical SAM protein [Candidatus Polarisedimenticolia bacterium]